MLTADKDKYEPKTSDKNILNLGTCTKYFNGKRQFDFMTDIYLRPNSWYYNDVQKLAIHELIHAFGFVHSKNAYSIMYPYSKLGQKLTEEDIQSIEDALNKVAERHFTQTQSKTDELEP